MERLCLIIDDNDQEGAILAYGKKLKNGDTVRYERIEPQVDEKIMDVSLDKTVAYITEKCRQNRVSVIACDMTLGENFYGLDVARKLIQTWPVMPIFLYSGDFDRVAEQVKTRLDDKTSELSPREHLRVLTKIKDYVDRLDKLDEHILNFLNEDSSIFTQVSEKLMEYPDATLKHGYEHFHGKKLHAIASEVMRQSHHGQGFAHEVISRAISHLIELNK